MRTIVPGTFVRIVRLVLLTIAFASLASSAQAASYRITTEDGFPVRLGPWKVKVAPHLRDGVAALGEASAVRPGRGVCDVEWKMLGLRTKFTSFGGVEDFCEDGFIQTAIIRSRKWVTWAGLRVGMRSSRVRELHRKARFRRGKWVLATQSLYGSEPAPTVSALVRDGRVSALSLWIGRAGD